MLCIGFSTSGSVGRPCIDLPVQPRVSYNLSAIIPWLIDTRFCIHILEGEWKGVTGGGGRAYFLSSYLNDCFSFIILDMVINAVFLIYYEGSRALFVLIIHSFHHHFSCNVNFTSRMMISLSI